MAFISFLLGGFVGFILAALTASNIINAKGYNTFDAIPHKHTDCTKNDTEVTR